MKVTQMPPVHAASPVANTGNAAYGVDVIAPKFDRDLNSNIAEMPVKFGSIDK